jgi:hypothetical protein
MHAVRPPRRTRTRLWTEFAPVYFSALDVFKDRGIATLGPFSLKDARYTAQEFYRLRDAVTKAVRQEYSVEASEVQEKFIGLKTDIEEDGKGQYLLRLRRPPLEINAEELSRLSFEGPINE